MHSTEKAHIFASSAGLVMQQRHKQEHFEEDSNNLGLLVKLLTRQRKLCLWNGDAKATRADRTASDKTLTLKQLS